MKKKFLSKMMMVALVICSMFLISACSWRKDVNIRSIEINQESVPAIIRVGEFDEAGIELTVTYEDNSTETIPVTSELIPEEHLSCLETPGIYEIEILFKGEKAILNITIVEAATYMVEFYNGNNKLIERQFVKEGEDAVAPSETAYAMFGYEFVGWDRLITNVTEDIKVYGVYSKLTTEDMNALVHEKMVNALTYMYEHDYVATAVGLDTYVNYHAATIESQVVMYYESNVIMIENLSEDGMVEYEQGETGWENGNYVWEDLTTEQIYASVMFGGDMLSTLFNEETEYSHSYVLAENRNIYTFNARVNYIEEEYSYTEELEFVFDDEKMLSFVYTNIGPDGGQEEEVESYTMLFEYKTENFFLLGDANQDGIVDETDATTVLRWAMKEVALTSLQELIADVNLDGVIDVDDALYVNWYVDGKIPYLPFTNKFGDVDFNGVVDNLDVLTITSWIGDASNLTAEQKVVADVNLDGEIDYFDAWLIRKHYTGDVESLPCTCICGDVNSDGEINNYDSELLSQYLNGEANLTGLGLVCADVNLDGEVNETDLTLLQQYINGEITTFPYEIPEE